MALDQEIDDGEVLDYEDPAEGRRNIISDAFDEHDENIAEITEPEVVKAPEPVDQEAHLAAIPTNAPDVDKAPASWTPASREHWAAIPEGVRGEIAKRETELQRTLNETAQARQFTQHFQQQIQPYEGMFRAQGVNATTGIGNVLQTAAQLQMGTPAQRAQTVAGLINQFGVDIATLDDLLVGNMPKASEASPEVAQLQQQIAQMQQFIHGQQGQQQQQMMQQQQHVQNETSKFIAENEFASDLRNVMADFMDVAERQGRQMTLQEAYNSALATRPDIQEIIANRENANSNRRAVSGARRAAVSVPQSHGTGGGVEAPTSTRDALLAAWDDHS